MKISTFLSSIILLLFSLNGSSQQTTPVPVELFAGHRAMSYQHVISKNLFNDKFNFFNVSAFDVEYKQNTNNVFIIQSLFSYKLGKGFSISVGAELQNVGAFSLTGLQYVYASDRMLIVSVSTVNLNGETGFQQFSLLEYRPKLNDKLNAYFRTQVLATTNFKQYNRGYQQVRLGLEKGILQFGLAATYDQFNANAITTANYGGFIRVLIF